MYVRSEGLKNRGASAHIFQSTVNLTSQWPRLPLLQRNLGCSLHLGAFLFSDNTLTPQHSKPGALHQGSEPTEYGDLVQGNPCFSNKHSSNIRQRQGSSISRKLVSFSCCRTRPFKEWVGTLRYPWEQPEAELEVQLIEIRPRTVVLVKVSDFIHGLDYYLSQVGLYLTTMLKCLPPPI